MDKRELLRSIPKIDEVLQERRLCVFFEDTPRQLIVEAIRQCIDETRNEILQGTVCAVEHDQLLDQIIARIQEKKKKSLRRAINATGIVLHTNLGRANLANAAGESVVETALHYSTLEYDVKKGTRGSRHDHVEALITQITGAEAAMVVNNNAAATMLCLSAMACGKEVIVSRGELVEIGGSFRVPEIMSQSGATLKEIGTTNKTKITDYIYAISEETAALMKVHTSNYKIVGFTETVELPVLVELGNKQGIPVIYDMGSGLMVHLDQYGIHEPTVQESLDTGVDVLLFSGDKLLGGPQGGIIVGKKRYIEQMKQHPLARILRVDKMTLAAMEATFRIYLDADKAMTEIPVIHMLTASAEELRNRAELLAHLLEPLQDKLTISVEETENQVGGGSAPTTLLSGYAVVLYSDFIPAERIERLLRKHETPIIVRISKGKLYMDVRTMQTDEISIVADAMIRVALHL